MAAFHFKFRRLVIIESKEIDEPSNGISIEQRLRLPWAAKGLSIKRTEVSSVSALLASIEQLTLAVPEEGVPLLHIEAHGDAVGVVTADGGTATWRSLREPLQQLNMACRGQLIVILGVCDGIQLWRSMMDDGVDPTTNAFVPWAIYVGLPGTVRALSMEDAWQEFYSRILETRSIDRATAAANKILQHDGQPELDVATAFDYLTGTAEHYMRLYNHRVAFRMRAERFHRQLKNDALRAGRTPPTPFFTRQIGRDVLATDTKDIFRSIAGIDRFPDSPLAEAFDDFFESLNWRMVRRPCGKAERRAIRRQMRRGIIPTHRNLGVFS